MADELRDFAKTLAKIHARAKLLVELTDAGGDLVTCENCDHQTRRPPSEWYVKFTSALRWALSQAYTPGGGGLDTSRPAEGSYSDPTGLMAVGPTDGEDGENDAPDPRVVRREALREANRKLKAALDEMRDSLGSLFEAARISRKDELHDLPFDKTKGEISEKAHAAALEARAERHKRGEGWGAA